MANLEEGTSDLISSLLVNDREEVYDDREPVIEPRHAIKELVRRGRPVIPALTRLIERYEKENDGRYYIEYVIEILGRIGGNQSSKLILRILLTSSTITNDDGGSMCTKWLRNLGETAVPAIVRFVEENRDATFAVMAAAEAVEEIKDRRLVPLLVKLLGYPNPVVVQSALISLQRQDDKSVVPHVIPLLQYQHGHPAEQRQTREFALGALESLLREDQRLLRQIKSDPESKPKARHIGQNPMGGVNARVTKGSSQ